MKGSWRRSPITAIALAVATWLLIIVTAHPYTPAAGAINPASQAIAQNTPQPDNPEGTTLLEAEGSLDGDEDTFEDGSLYEIHSFEGEAGQTLTIRMVSDEFDTYLILIDAAEDTIGWNDDTTPSDTNSTLIVSLPETGTYWILATAFDNTQRGNYRLTIATASAAETQQGEADRLFEEGLQQYDASQFEAAVESWQQALGVYQAIDLQQMEAETLFHLGAAHFALGQSQQAIEVGEKALAVARAIGYSEAEVYTLGFLGIVYDSQGRYRQAIDLRQQSLELARQIGDRYGELAALENLGNAHNHLGQSQQAIDFHEQALAIARELGDRQIESSSLGNLGNAYGYLGKSQQAIDLHQQALAIAREIGDRPEEARALSNLGFVYESLGQSQQAVEFYQQYLDIIREMGDRQGEANGLRYLGQSYASLNQLQQAIDTYQQALAIDREIQNRSDEAVTLDHLGNAYRSQGEYQQALDRYQQSIVVDQEIGSRQGEAASLNNIGLVFTDTHQFAEAETALVQAVEIFESLRTDLPDAQLISLADIQASTYANLERALIAQDKTAEALEITERARARAFVLQLASRLPAPQVRGVLANPEVEALPSIGTIQQIARDQNTTFVTYSLIRDEALYIWVLEPSGAIEFRSVEFEGSEHEGIALNPITAIEGPVYRSNPTPSELDTLVADSRRGLGIVEESSNIPNTQLSELHQVLIDPIADLLPTDPETPIVFVPQGALFLVPFPALEAADGSRLIEKHTVLTAPSIQVMGLAAGEASAGTQFLMGQNAILVGNPVMPEVVIPSEDGLQTLQMVSLPGAEAEALAIGELLDIAPLIGDQATEARVKQQLPQASLIHFATHGLLEYGAPESSGVSDVPGAVALTAGEGEDGLLTAAEILDVNLQAELVVLSACDTGRGRITGDGVVGLSRSLITAGVPSVIVSLWAVPDAPTAALMTEFYRQLQQGQTKAQALRQAMLATLEDTPDPVNWAAFTLIGAIE